MLRDVAAKTKMYAKKGRVMPKKLYIGGLSWNTTVETLRATFERFGEVADAKIITDQYSGKSRGFGFVTYAEPQAADAAIAELNGKELDGRTITVDEARERQGGGGRGGGGGGRGGGRGGGGRGGYGGGRGGGGGGRDRY